MLGQGVDSARRAKEKPGGARKKGRIRLPILRSKEPGALQLTNGQIYEIVPFP
jgi:hypothetical protein